jgi:hypothetical protein
VTLKEILEILKLKRGTQENEPKKKEKKKIASIISLFQKVWPVLNNVGEQELWKI